MDRSLNGIISYLTRKHGGNLHDQGIVTITSSSVWSRYVYGERTYFAQNVADLRSDSFLCSDHEPGQCRPTHYPMRPCYMRTWVLETSLDGEEWTEVDRQADRNLDPFDIENASFACSKPSEGRFVRLTPTRPTTTGTHILVLRVFEFFGTLFE
jgi:hypothetical protein